MILRVAETVIHGLSLAPGIGFVFDAGGIILNFVGAMEIIPVVGDYKPETISPP